MTSDAPIDEAPADDPLPQPPSTEEIIEYLRMVSPILANVDAARMKAEQFATRLHERGIDFRDYLVGAEVN